MNLKGIANREMIRPKDMPKVTCHSCIGVLKRWPHFQTGWMAIYENVQEKTMNAYFILSMTRIHFQMH